MTEQYISFETAKLAKEKGFDEFNNVYWDKNKIVWTTQTNDKINRPEHYYINTQSLLQKWLREKHKIRVFATHSSIGTFNFEIYKWNYDNQIGKWERIGNISSFSTYEEALEEGLKQGLNLI